MSDEPKSFWAKLAVITAFLSALGGLVTVTSRCSESEPAGSPTHLAPQATPNYPPVQAAPSSYPVQPAYSPPAYQPPPVYPTSPQSAAFCCDLAGMRRCQLVAPAPAGSPCFCVGQGSGYSCP